MRMFELLGLGEPGAHTGKEKASGARPSALLEAHRVSTQAHFLRAEFSAFPVMASRGIGSTRPKLKSSSCRCTMTGRNSLWSNPIQPWASLTRLSSSQAPPGSGVIKLRRARPHRGLLDDGSKPGGCGTGFHPRDRYLPATSGASSRFEPFRTRAQFPAPANAAPGRAISQPLLSACARRLRPPACRSSSRLTAARRPP